MSQNRKFKFKGKQVLLLGLAALVITAGYYRWTVETEKYNSVPVVSEALPANGENQEENKEAQNENQENASQGGEKAENQNQSLAQLRQERDSARSEAMEQWEKTAKSSEAGAETKQEAEKKVKAANEYSEKEKSIETLVKAKGFEDCFAHVNEAGVTVRVKGGEINGSKVAQIKDIIVAETGVEVRNIRISAE